MHMIAPAMLHFLLIDDDEAANFLNSRLIKKVLPQVPSTSFTEAKKALDFLGNLTIQQKREMHFLILLDINMPVMDGFEFLDVLVSSPALRQNVSVVILSSSVNWRDKEKAANYELLDYFPKPLTQERIRHLFENLSEDQNIQNA